MAQSAGSKAYGAESRAWTTGPQTTDHGLRDSAKGMEQRVKGRECGLWDHGQRDNGPQDHERRGSAESMAQSAKSREQGTVSLVPGLRSSVCTTERKAWTTDYGPRTARQCKGHGAERKARRADMKGQRLSSLSSVRSSDCHGIRFLRKVGLKCGLSTMPKRTCYTSGWTSEGRK
jgi:hypothetical protein